MVQATTTYLIVLSVCAILFAGCADSNREEVIERYQSGAKKIVAVYTGEGASERLIERQTYSESGALIILDNRIDGTRQDYVDLNPVLLSPAGLSEYVQGTWQYSTRNDDTTYSTRKARVELTYRGDTLETTFFWESTTDLDIELFESAFVRTDVSLVEFRDSLIIVETERLGGAIQSDKGDSTWTISPGDSMRHIPYREFHGNVDTLEVLGPNRFRTTALDLTNMAYRVSEHTRVR